MSFGVAFPDSNELDFSVFIRQFGHDELFISFQSLLLAVGRLLNLPKASLGHLIDYSDFFVSEKELADRLELVVELSGRIPS